MISTRGAGLRHGAHCVSASLHSNVPSKRHPRALSVSPKILALKEAWKSTFSNGPTGWVWHAWLGSERLSRANAGLGQARRTAKHQERKSQWKLRDWRLHFRRVQKRMVGTPGKFSKRFLALGSGGFASFDAKGRFRREKGAAKGRRLIFTASGRWKR